jgi:hypothetical protein
MTPETKSELSKFTTAAKLVIFNPERMRQFLPMLESTDGAIQAVQTIIGAIEQKKQVPPDVAPLLGVNVYLLLVDMAKEITGQAPDPQVVKDVVVQILEQMSSAYQEGGEAPEQEQSEMPQEQAQEQAQGVERPIADKGLIGRQIGA